MNKATQLLFHPLGSHKPLFRNQLELVNLLLLTEGSKYYLNADATEEAKTKALGRLKTFISQLLSDTVVRAITEDFKDSLKLILTNKLAPAEVEVIFDKIIAALQQKNDSLSKPQESETSTAVKLSLKDDIANANYISVITSRPIDMDTHVAEDGFSIRKYFFDDLVKTLTSPQEHQKYYRFNFPMDSYCELFWLGLEKIIRRFLLDRRTQQDFFRQLYDHQFFITTESYQQYERYMTDPTKLKNEETEEEHKRLFSILTGEIIERLNRNKVLMVFSVDLPVFTIPTIAINPNESTAKLYSLLDFEDRKNLVYRFTPENVVLWRIFVWDKIKATKKGCNIPFKCTIPKA